MSQVDNYATLPFIPHPDGTVTLAATGSSARVALARAQNQTVIITAPSTNSDIAFIKFGDVTVTADVANDTPILPATVQTFHVIEGWTHVAGIMASGSGTLYATVGDGI